ncbi:MAG: DUF6485 family protein [Tannerella sp.]|jgi:hypothetical protein|nr:DUF6485 family protein [Tannerella sp.]
MNKHFCNCPAVNCPQHPSNHNDGCDPCIVDNLKKKKMPACFFRAVKDDVSDVTDYSIKGFVEFYMKNKED